MTLVAVIVAAVSTAAVAGWGCVAATCWYESRRYFHGPHRTLPPVGWR